MSPAVNPGSVWDYAADLLKDVNKDYEQATSCCSFTPNAEHVESTVSYQPEKHKVVVVQFIVRVIAREPEVF